MSKRKTLGGSSSKNSVSYFFSGRDIGIEAARETDGSISIKEISQQQQSKIIIQLLKIILMLGLLREVCFCLNFPMWLYHIPTVFYVLIFVIGIVAVLVNRDTRMYHGAEHKVVNWYRKHKKEFEVEEIQKASRIHVSCGTNLLATIVTFQLAASISIACFDFHIPEIIIIAAPMFLYTLVPFNILGLLTQIITTAEPKEEHISVAVKALTMLIEKNEGE